MAAKKKAPSDGRYPTGDTAPQTAYGRTTVSQPKPKAKAKKKPAAKAKK